ncbi:hypothetical protein NUU61_003522 [Penicillium alfredii]|uniref:AA1-like domain-containing protein n=1 Tax=Penicillium alfredii TaxID=1506179 RepID=A0A9W9FJK8_9EURO|nr:uncharacterized protein NUU61_003522 [Penicillium alfredii]KAJ5101300.1 hypothetical protein NUU61_003522 [Penicillium alfredii]
MKTAAITTFILATTGTTLAAPSMEKRALQPFRISTLRAALYNKEHPERTRIIFGLSDPNHKFGTTCTADWTSGMGGDNKFNCSSTDYRFSFPNGINDIQKFDLSVAHVDGIESSAGKTSVHGDSWKCKTVSIPENDPAEKCEWDGTLEVKVTLST